MARTSAEALSETAGRASPERSDSRDTRMRLVAAVQQWVAAHGTAPARLADVATTAGVSTATAYRHFASVDNAIQAFVLQLPTRAVEIFEESGGPSGEPLDAFHRWNQSWVTSCLEHGPLAVHLRSPLGFLERRANGDPVIGYACAQIEPLLEALGSNTLMRLFTWNVTSDPREVLDLTQLGWTPERIADFVTQSVLATPEV
jgi:AcrR family transcriptional regulator